jgi:dTDP-L-rhamnose 4-epimerase
MNILITGGVGFIGSNLARRILKEGHNVTLFDNLSPQIHGQLTIPPDLEEFGLEGAKLLIGDVCDKEAFHRALAEQDVVVHLAAETGTGQSMYEIERYEKVNIGGTAILLDYLVNHKENQIKKLVVASSRSIYGEGKYHCVSKCGTVYPKARSTSAMQSGQFEVVCPTCGSDCEFMLTDESSVIHPSSFYGLTKQVQEQTILMFAQTLGISGFALRYQNVYGPGQSLKNPYTGILAIFSNQARVNKPIYIFEDGEESRDFVYIDDVVEATWRCIKPETSGIAALNVGSGDKTTVSEVVKEITNYFNSSSTVKITGEFREGDIRHNVADLTRIRELLDFEPQWKFSDGIKQFLDWASRQEISSGKYEQSLQEMKDKGLMHG